MGCLCVSGRYAIAIHFQTYNETEIQPYIYMFTFFRWPGTLFTRLTLKRRILIRGRKLATVPGYSKKGLSN